MEVELGIKILTLTLVRDEPIEAWSWVVVLLAHMPLADVCRFVAGGLKLTLVKSLIGATKRQRETVYGLGLRRIRHTVERQDTPEVRGMVTKVAHLIEVVEG